MCYLLDFLKVPIKFLFPHYLYPLEFANLPFLLANSERKRAILTPCNSQKCCLLYIHYLLELEPRKLHLQESNK